MSSFPPPPPPPASSLGVKKFPGTNVVGGGSLPPRPAVNNNNNINNNNHQFTQPPAPPSSAIPNSLGRPPTNMSNNTNATTPLRSSSIPLQQQPPFPGKFPPPQNHTNGSTPLSKPPGPNNNNNNNQTPGGPASPSPVRPFGYQTPVNNVNTNSNNNNIDGNGQQQQLPVRLGTSTSSLPPAPVAGSNKFLPPPPNVNFAKKMLPPPVNGLNMANNQNNNQTNNNNNNILLQQQQQQAKKPAPILRDIGSNGDHHVDPFSNGNNNKNNNNNELLMINKNKEPPKMLPAKTSAGIGQTITHLKAVSNTNNRLNNNNTNSPHGNGPTTTMTASAANLRSPSESFNGSFDGGPSYSANSFDPATDQLPPLLLPSFPPPVSICVSGNGQVIQTSTAKMQIDSASLFQILKSSEYDVGRSYASGAESVTNAVQVNDKENLTTKQELVLKAVEELGNSRSDLLSCNNKGSNMNGDNLLTQMLKHMISTATTAKSEDIAITWGKDTVSTYVPMLDRFTNRPDTSGSLPCPRVSTSTSSSSSEKRKNEPFDGNSEQVEDNKTNNNAKNQAATRIQDLIVAGDRAQAVAIALENGMYAEALLTAMLCDKSVFENAVQTFVEHNVDRSSPLGQAFLLFNELPLSPPESLNVEHWAHHIKMLLCNYSAAGLVQGVANWSDALMQKGLVDEAHLCLLLLQQSPAWQSATVVTDNLRSRIHLIGGAYKRQGCRKAFVNFRSLYLSDAMEYSKQRSINEKFIRPPLIPFKLVHGLLLQELGLLEKAGSYFDAVTRILAPGTPKQLLDPKVCRTRASTAIIPASLVQLNETSKYILNDYFKTLEGKAGSPVSGGANGANAAGGGGGILGWFGLGGGAKKSVEPVKQTQTIQSNNTNNNTIRSNSTPAPRTTSSNNETPNQFNDNNNNLASNNTAPASSNQQPPTAATTNPSSGASNRSASQSRVAGLFTSIGGLFRRSASAAPKDGEPPAKAMILDSEPVPEWDPINKCYKRILTEEEKKIEEMTKKGPPKENPRSGMNVNTNVDNGNGVQQPQHNNGNQNVNNNNFRQNNITNGMPANNNNNNNIRGGMVGGRPPPPPNRFVASGVQRYADSFNSGGQ